MIRLGTLLQLELRDGVQQRGLEWSQESQSGPESLEALLTVGVRVPTDCWFLPVDPECVLCCTVKIRQG